MAECAAVCEHAHLPLQSGSTRHPQGDAPHVHAPSATSRLVAELRAAIPDLALGTDIIVGFPGETEDDFARDARASSRRSRYDSAFTFVYSPRARHRRRRRCPTRCREDVKRERIERLVERRPADRARAQRRRASGASRRCSSRGRAAPIRRCPARPHAPQHDGQLRAATPQPGELVPVRDRGRDARRRSAARSRPPSRPSVAAPPASSASSGRPRAGRAPSPRRCARLDRRRGRLRGRDAGLPRASRSSRTSRRRALVGDLAARPRGLGRRVRALAHAAIDEALAAGRTPVVVGGTGLYFRAALAELELPPAPPTRSCARASSALRRARPRARARAARRARPARRGARPPERPPARRPRARARRARALARTRASDRLWDADTRAPDARSSASTSRADVLAGADRRRAPHAMFDARRRGRGRARPVPSRSRRRRPRSSASREVAELPARGGDRRDRAAHAPLRRLPAQVDAPHPGPRAARRDAPASELADSDRCAPGRRTRE